jgi:uncharacterized protein YbaR (Trm112 family)
MFEEQGGVCAICRNPEASKKICLSVDHDHATGKVRGLLCMRCNTAIERIDNVPDFLKNAATYLEVKDIT